MPLLPNLSISNTPQGGSSYTVGQTVTFDVVVSNDAAAAPENVPNSIVVTDIAPLGLTGISGSGTGWTVVINSAAAHPAVGPAELVATYTGSYPILPGATLPPLLITGTLTADAVPSLTNTAVLTVFNNGGTNTAASATITVGPSTGTPGTGTPGTGLREQVLQETGTPGTGTPGTGTPGTGTPGTGTPGTGTPGTGTPGTGTPGTGTPGTGTPTTLPPSLSITKVNLGGDNFVVGQTITYQLVVTDNATSGPVVAPNPITVTDIAPVGLVGMSANSVSAWTLSLSTTTSPAVMTATYNGAYPVMPGTVMPPITITGIFAASAVPSFTNTAAVTSPGDPSISNGDIATDTVFVAPRDHDTLGPHGTTTPVIGTTTPVIGTTTPVTGSPDLSIVKTNLHGDNFNVGDQVTYVLVVSDLPGASSVVSPNPITVSDAIPVGESNLQADGQGWSFTYSNQSGPAIITATYTGSYPVAAGTTLPSITITATLTSDAIPSVTDTATVDTLGNLGTYNTATDTVYVYQQNQCPSSNDQTSSYGSDQNGSIAGSGSVSDTPTIPATDIVPGTVTVLGTDTVPATDTASATDTVPTDTVPATETVPGSSDGSSDPNSYSDQGNNGDCNNNGDNGNNHNNGNNGNNGNNNNQNGQNGQDNFNFNHDNSNNHNNNNSSNNNNSHSNFPALPLTGSDPELKNQ